MRRIDKGAEPRRLTEARALGVRYRDLDPETKQAVREALNREQRGLCCYCTSRITPSEQGMRVEHFIPRSDEERGLALELDWRNLYGSCRGSAGSSRLHCDASKADKRLRLSLTSAAVGEKVTFRASGEVDSPDPEWAQDLIWTLYLNRPHLVRGRKAVLQAFMRALQPAAGRLGPDAVRKRARAWVEEGLLLKEFAPIVEYYAHKRR